MTRMNQYLSELGQYRIIDLDLSRYDQIAQRFHRERRDSVSFLKSDIDTRNPGLNRTIEQIEHVAVHSPDPILLMGPTGAGKSQLARRIFELKQQRRQVADRFIEVNCATIRGEAVMSTLFGHKKGTYTGAVQNRAGLLREANGGMLFLDKVGELGVDKQAMLLRAIEEKRFMPMGSDRGVQSDFQLICGINRDLVQVVKAGRFRDAYSLASICGRFDCPGWLSDGRTLSPTSSMSSINSEHGPDTKSGSTRKRRSGSLHSQLCRGPHGRLISAISTLRSPACQHLLPQAGSRSRPSTMRSNDCGRLVN